MNNETIILLDTRYLLLGCQNIHISDECYPISYKATGDILGQTQLIIVRFFCPKNEMLHTALFAPIHILHEIYLNQSCLDGF